MHDKLTENVGLFDGKGFAPSNIALIDGHDGQSITYNNLQHQVNRYSALLTCKGQKIGLMMENTIEFVVAILSIIQSGNVVAPLDYKMTETELVMARMNLGIQFILQTGQLNEEEIEKIVHSANEDKEVTFSLILCTSGTTSKPKKVPIKASVLWRNAALLAEAYELTNEDCTIGMMPFHHGHGLIGCLLTSLFSGGITILMRHFSAFAFLDCSKWANVTWLTGSPAIFQIILSNPERNLSDSVQLNTLRSTLRFIRTCSSPISTNLQGNIQKYFGDKILTIQAYGMTEAAHVIATQTLMDCSMNGSVGKPYGVQISIDEGSGEICVRGEGVIEGYLEEGKEEHAERFTQDGYLRTGDYGFIDNEGNLFIRGRLKELINRGGEKISCTEVEQVIQNVPGVREVACFPTESDLFGEEVGCLVSTLQDDHDRLRSEINNWCRNQMSRSKVPRTIYFTKDALPRSSVGKLQRSAIKLKCFK